MMVGESQHPWVAVLAQHIVIEKGEQRVGLHVVEITQMDMVKREEDKRGGSALVRADSFPPKIYPLKIIPFSFEKPHENVATCEHVYTKNCRYTTHTH